MKALSQLFDSTTLLVPSAALERQAGEVPLEGHNLSVAPLSMPRGRGLIRKLGLIFWLAENSPVIVRELLKADAVHAPIPGDIGTIGMLLAFVLRKPLFVRHCGNWLRPVTRAEIFWKWFMEMFAGGKQVMLATGGSQQPPSRKNAAIRWIFSTTLTEDELRSCARARELPSSNSAKLIIVCRQEREKGTGVVIETLPLILKSLPEVSLDVVGDGAALVEFQNLAESLGVSDRVVFHGKLDHLAVVNLLKQADLFCYPTSASEGFPKVVLEALACGLPVITTRVSVLPELIGAGGGELLDKATPEAVAESVIRILSDSNRYSSMSALAIETAGRFSLESWRDTIGARLRTAWGDLQAVEHESTGAQIDLTKLRVCFLAGTLGRGGAERQLIFMLRALKQAGVDLRVLCLTSGEALEKEIRDMGIAVTWVGASRWRAIRLLQIMREFRREPADIVQSAHFYTNLYAAVAGRLLGIKSIGAVRNDLTSELKSNGVMAWGQLHLPGQLIANSRLARQRAIAEGVELENIKLVRNVVNINGLGRKSKGGNGNGNGQVRILFAGRLTQQKRPDRFLQVLQKIVQRSPNLNFKATIVGDGPLRHGLEKRAESLRLTPKYLEFLGELADLRSTYLEADMLVLTSDWEGTPNVVLEAMASSMPVVATRVGGVPDIVEHGKTGYLAEPHDEDSMVENIASLITDSTLRAKLGLGARAYVLEHHSDDHLSKFLGEIYKAAL